jgi:hypothetical protein
MQAPLARYKEATETPIMPPAVLFAPSELKDRIR